jgi:hypothetical protein
MDNPEKTGNIRYTRHRTKTGTKNHTTQKTIKMSDTDPPKSRDEPRRPRRANSSCLV